MMMERGATSTPLCQIMELIERYVPHVQMEDGELYITSIPFAHAKYP